MPGRARAATPSRGSRVTIHAAMASTTRMLGVAGRPPGRETGTAAREAGRELLAGSKGRVSHIWSLPLARLTLRVQGAQGTPAAEPGLQGPEVGLRREELEARGPGLGSWGASAAEGQTCLSPPRASCRCSSGPFKSHVSQSGCVANMLTHPVPPSESVCPGATQGWQRPLPASERSPSSAHTCRAQQGPLPASPRSPSSAHTCSLAASWRSRASGFLQPLTQRRWPVQQAGGRNPAAGTFCCGHSGRRATGTGLGNSGSRELGRGAQAPQPRSSRGGHGGLRPQRAAGRSPSRSSSAVPAELQRSSQDQGLGPAGARQGRGRGGAGRAPRGGPTGRPRGFTLASGRVETDTGQQK